MKKITLLVLALLSWPALALDAGAPAPEAAGPGLVDGRPVRLSDLRGKVVLVDFWASWCGPCKVSLPELETLRRELHQLGYGQRFEVLAVNVDSDAEDGRKFLKARPVSYPVLSDPAGRVPEAFELPTMPTSYLLGADGRVVAVHEGYRPGDAAKLKERIIALLGSAK